MRYEYRTLVFDQDLTVQESDTEFRHRARSAKRRAVADGWEHMNEFADVGHIAIWLRRKAVP